MAKKNARRTVEDALRGDPWKTISPADVQAKLESEFQPVPSLSSPDGRVFVPERSLSIASFLVDLIPQLQEESDEDKEMALEMIVSDGVWDHFEELTQVKNEWLVKCGNPSSMVSAIWGLCTFTLGKRGYLFHVPDFGVGADETLELLSAWEPVENQEAFSACFLSTYASYWTDFGLPPLLGEVAQGPPDLMERAIYDALEEDPECWEQVLDTIQQAHGKGKLYQTIIEGLLGEGDPQTLAAIQPGRLTPEEKKGLVEVYWRCIEDKERK